MMDVLTIYNQQEVSKTKKKWMYQKYVKPKKWMY